MRLTEEQQRQRVKMQHKLERKIRTAVLPEQMTTAFQSLAAQPVSRQRGPRTALRLARTLLAQRLNVIFAVRRAITGEDDVNGLHNLRIAIKKLRYALEAMEFAAGENAAANLKFFKKLQSALGELHDRDVFIATVKQRYETLQGKTYSGLLRAGYEKIFAQLARQRHEFYQEYLQLFAEAKIAEWRKLVLPPLPAVQKKPATREVESNGNLPQKQITGGITTIV